MQAETRDGIDGVKLITAEQRKRALELASTYLDRSRLCGPEQPALAQTFLEGVKLLTEIAA